MKLQRWHTRALFLMAGLLAIALVSGTLFLSLRSMNRPFPGFFLLANSGGTGSG